MSAVTHCGGHDRVSPRFEFPIDIMTPIAYCVIDLAIEDIRAREHRGTTGTLASMENVSEAPAPGAKLITRRSQVRVLAPLQNGRSEAI